MEEIGGLIRQYPLYLFSLPCKTSIVCLCSVSNFSNTAIRLSNFSCSFIGCLNAYAFVNPIGCWILFWRRLAFLAIFFESYALFIIVVPMIIVLSIPLCIPI
jgi:hypothetical protein